MHTGYIYLVIGICMLLAVGFGWQEYARKNKRYVLLRVVAVILAAVALACIALPVSYNGSITKTDGSKTILLTRGFDADSLTADWDVVTMDADIKRAYPKARLINGISELTKTAALHIYGYGLGTDELAELDSLPLVFHGATLPDGVRHISWNGTLRSGEALHVQGTYNNTSAKKVKLVLRGLNTGLDSVTISPKAKTAFSLQAIPKAMGRIVYTLYADTSLQGNIPVQVNAVAPLKVLMLSASPDFESKFLKNWLAGKGYSVASRAAISKQKFNSDYINVAQLNLDKISAPLLEKFDVVIGDLSVINGLSLAETGALRQQIADKGLGLIVRADSAGKTSWAQKQFPVYTAPGKEPAPSQLTINGEKSRAKLNYTAAHIVYQNGTQPLVQAGDRTLVSRTIYGSGKVILTTLNSTYAWMLAGNSQDYSALWSSLITRAARRAEPAGSKAEFNSMPYVGKPAQIKLTQPTASPVTINGNQVPTLQNSVLPFEYGIKYWPVGAGWQNVVQNGVSSSWYAYPAGQWQAMQAAEKISATKKYADIHKIADIVTKQIQQKVRIDVPKIYFYILLLAACTFLWIETKL